MKSNINEGDYLIEHIIVKILPGKVVIGAESWLKLNHAKEKTDELGAEDDNSSDVKEANEKFIELALNNKVFKGMQCDVENKAVFDTFDNICLVYFSARWIGATMHITFTESDETFAKMLLENNIDDY